MIVKVDGLKFFILGLLALFNLGCGEIDDSDQTTINEEKAIIGVDGELFVKRAISLTEKHNLSRLPMSCIRFVEPEDVFNDDLIYVNVREIHNKECGGDPETSPRLFSIGFKLNTSEVWTDARSEDAMMELLEKTEG